LTFHPPKHSNISTQSWTWHNYNHTCQVGSRSAEQESMEAPSWRQSLGSFASGGKSQLRRGPNSPPRSSDTHRRVTARPAVHKRPQCRQTSKMCFICILENWTCGRVKPLVRDNVATELQNQTLSQKGHENASRTRRCSSPSPKQPISALTIANARQQDTDMTCSQI